MRRGDRSDRPVFVFCGSGGIGRRAGLRIQWGNPWGFESPLSHSSGIAGRADCSAIALPDASFASRRAGPARGRLFQNDIITAVLFPTPRKEVKSVADLQSVLSRAKDGDIVSLQVFNPGVQGAATRVVNIRVGSEK